MQNAQNFKISISNREPPSFQEQPKNQQQTNKNKINDITKQIKTKLNTKTKLIEKKNYNREKGKKNVNIIN